MTEKTIKFSFSQQINMHSQYSAGALESDCVFQLAKAITDKFIKVKEVGIDLQEYTLDVYVLPVNQENKKLLELARKIKIERLPNFKFKGNRDHVWDDNGY